jgi:hypothetical protein
MCYYVVTTQKFMIYFIQVFLRSFFLSQNFRFFGLVLHNQQVNHKIVPLQKIKSIKNNRYGSCKI